MKKTIRMKDGFTFLGHTHAEVDAIGKHFAYKTYEGVTYQIANGTYDILEDEQDRPFGPPIDYPADHIKTGAITAEKITPKGSFLSSAVNSMEKVMDKYKPMFENLKISDSVKIIPGSIKIPGLSMAQALKNMEESNKHWPSAKDLIPPSVKDIEDSAMRVQEAIKKNDPFVACEEDLPWIEDTDELRYFPDNDLANAEELKRAQALIRALRERSKRQGAANKRLNERLNKEVKEHLNLAMRTNEELKAELDSYVSDIETLKGEIRSHESAIEGLVQERDKWMKDFEGEKKFADIYKARMDGAYKEIKKLKDERDEHKELIESLKEELHCIKHKHNQTVSEKITIQSELALFKRIVNNLV